MANLTPEQQAFTDKIIRLAQSDEAFGQKLEANQKEALVAAGLWEEYAEIFSDDVSGYVRAVASDSICCQTSICCESSACCETV